eukprot:TRINITY_DN9249_c0_g1_i4.p1 TRINITY_DN9249_c0_g1~~TRINITY_DN9249_c0_g1_i4.p1  ORF type:complete len:215 (-),score=52.35 TRINITY_DN9249_c0_g1_i4:118-762(-)
MQESFLESHIASSAEREIPKEDELLAYALEPPRSSFNGTRVLAVHSDSHEYGLIADMFRMGNCELNFVSKISNPKLHARFSKKLLKYNGQLSAVLLFFANTLEMLEEVIASPQSFREVSPQDLIFSTDLSIAYHFFKKQRGRTHNWKAIIGGVVLENVWNEGKSYALFALNFRNRVRSLVEAGYSVVYFSADNFYLSLIPEECTPIYLLDFTFV